MTSFQDWLRGPIQSFVVSQLYSLWSIIVTVGTVGWGLGPANGGYNDWPSFVVFLNHAWFGVFIGLVFGIGPYVRATQGAARVTASNALTTSPKAPSPPNPPTPPTPSEN